MESDFIDKNLEVTKLGLLSLSINMLIIFSVNYFVYKISEKNGKMPVTVSQNRSEHIKKSKTLKILFIIIYEIYK